MFQLVISVTFELIFNFFSQKCKA